MVGRFLAIQALHIFALKKRVGKVDCQLYSHATLETQVFLSDNVGGPLVVLGLVTAWAYWVVKTIHVYIFLEEMC